jgi:hypothetical protein
MVDMLRPVPDSYDQVARRLAFEQAHPDVRITFLGPAWQAVIPRPDGEDVTTRYELCALLDALEAKLPEATGEPGRPDPG